MNKRIRRKHAKQLAAVDAMLARRGEWHFVEASHKGGRARIWVNGLQARLRTAPERRDQR